MHYLLLQLHTIAKTAGMHHSEWVGNADCWVVGLLHTVAKTAGMHHSEWIENEYRWVAGLLHTVSKTAGMHHSEWVENENCWVAGFLEKFEEVCYIMVKFLLSFRLSGSCFFCLFLLY